MNSFYHFTFGNHQITYHWFGGLGCVFKSYENNVKEGDLRQINDIIFRADRITKNIFDRWTPCFSKPEIWWIPIEKFDAEWIRNFKKEVFSC